MRPDGVQRQLDMVANSASKWPAHKVEEAKQIFQDTATLECEHLLAYDVEKSSVFTCRKCGASINRYEVDLA
jgi:hypothetical protein